MDLFRRNKKDSPSSSTPVAYPTLSPPTPTSDGPSGTSAGSSYPRLAQPVVPNISRSVSFASPDPPTIRMVIKSQLRVEPAPQLSDMGADVSPTNFKFDTSLERQILADLSSSSSNRNVKIPPSLSALDPIVQKYVSMGLHRDAVILGLVVYGDVHNKILDFCSAFSLFNEMGFPHDKITGTLFISDNNRETALGLLAP